MKLSTKSRYALRGIIDLIIHSKERHVFIKEIAAREDISERYLENIFTQLRASGILVSSKGKNGGFKIAREPSKITLYDIIKAVEGEISIVECVEFPEACSKSGICFTRDVWAEINQTLKKKMESFNVETLVEKYKNAMK